MKFSCIKTTPLFIAMILLSLSTRAESALSLHGDAQLNYTKYSATFDKYSPLYNSPIGSPDDKQVSQEGSSFVQQYSAALTATNYRMRGQRQHYTLIAGYSWKQFNTKTADNDSNATYKGSAGNLNYSGNVVYDQLYLPVSLSLFAYDGRTNTDKVNIFSPNIINDNMASSIDDGGTISGWGGTFIFEPDRANNITLRGLPRLHVDYVERNALSPDQISEKTRELAVAGLCKENNWITYRFLQYDRSDYGTASGYREQAIQIGLVDYRKMRKWSALTNWINISADGQLTTKNTLITGDSSEEYDLNFFAVATRKTWNARTFLNYNRLTTQYPDAQGNSIERYRIPVSLKGIWGRDTDWFFRVSKDNSLEKENGLHKVSTASSSISLGGTTFKNSSFTFSPALSLTSYKNDTGVDYFDAALIFETRSTGRFSNKWNLSASSKTKYKDDGSANGVSWNESILFRTAYRPDSPFKYLFTENIQLGSGKDFIDMGNQTGTGLSGSTLESRPSNSSNGIADYLRSITTASFSWTKSAAFSTSFDGSYDVVSTNSTLDTITELHHRLGYNKNFSSFNLTTKYKLSDANGMSSYEFVNVGQFRYRPDTRNEGTLSYSYSQINSYGYTSTVYDLAQKYSLKFFSRNGVIRDLAAVSEEFSYKNQNSTAMYTFTLTGRYNPTAKTALYASVRSQIEPGIATLIYNAGATANFKLLSTSVDYISAKRDIDHRTEQRIATSIRRSF